MEEIFLFFIAFREQNVFKETDELAPDLPAGSEAEGQDVVIGDLRVQLEQSKAELEQTKEELLQLRLKYFPRNPEIFSRELKYFQAEQGPAEPGGRAAEGRAGGAAGRGGGGGVQADHHREGPDHRVPQAGPQGEGRRDGRAGG